MLPDTQGGAKRTRLSSQKSFHAQVLANLAALEEDGGETSTQDQWSSGSSCTQQQNELAQKGASQLVVYTPPTQVDGKSSTAAAGTVGWPWGVTYDCKHNSCINTASTQSICPHSKPALVALGYGSGRYISCSQSIPCRPRAFPVPDALWDGCCPFIT